MDEDVIEQITVKLDNVKPVEVMDFLTSIQGFQNEYKNIVKDQKLRYSDEDIKLYIHVREGCVEWIFSRLLVGFGQKARSFVQDKILQKAYNSVINNINKVQQEKQVEQNVDSLSNAQKVLAVSRSDLGSTLSIKYKNKDEESELKFEITGSSGRGVYDKIGELVEKIKLPKQEDFKNEVIQLTLNKNNTIKCKIESLCDREVTIICEDNLKRIFITENKDNPFSTYYVVNGKVKTIDGRIIAYEITEIIETIKE
jgi:hypothetical protein